MFRDRNAHALEKLVAEIGDVVFAELVVSEGEAVFIDKRWIKVGS